MKLPQLTAAELTGLLTAEFPQVFGTGALTIEDVWHGGCRLRQAFNEQSLRPGATIGGATIMAFGDYAVYVALLASIGWVPLAVTTSLNVNFLRKPAQRDLTAECRLIKLGKRLAVGDVTIRADGSQEAIAHLSATYSIPGQ